MSGAACSFWQKVLMAALSKVLVQVTEQSILRWMREREWRRERQREGERETETGKSSAPSGTGCTFVTLVLWSQISKSSTHALPSALRDLGRDNFSMNTGRCSAGQKQKQWNVCIFCWQYEPVVHFVLCNSRVCRSRCVSRRRPSSFSAVPACRRPETMLDWYLIKMLRCSECNVLCRWNCCTGQQQYCNRNCIVYIDWKKCRYLWVRRLWIFGFRRITHVKLSSCQLPLLHRAQSLCGHDRWSRWTHTAGADESVCGPLCSFHADTGD